MIALRTGRNEREVYVEGSRQEGRVFHFYSSPWLTDGPQTVSLFLTPSLDIFEVEVICKNWSQVRGHTPDTNALTLTVPCVYGIF